MQTAPAAATSRGFWRSTHTVRAGLALVLSALAIQLAGCPREGDFAPQYPGPSVVYVEPTHAHPFQLVRVHVTYAGEKPVRVRFGDALVPALTKHTNLMGRVDYVVVSVPLVPPGPVSIQLAPEDPAAPARDEGGAAAFDVLDMAGGNPKAMALRLTEPLAATLEALEIVLPKTVDPTIRPSFETALKKDIAPVRNAVAAIKAHIESLKPNDALVLDAALSANGVYSACDNIKAYAAQLAAAATKEMTDIASEMVRIQVDQFSAMLGVLVSTWGAVDLGLIVASFVAGQAITAGELLSGGLVPLAPATEAGDAAVVGGLFAIQIVVKWAHNLIEVMPVSITSEAIGDAVTGGISVNLGAETTLAVSGTYTAKADIAEAALGSIIDGVFGVFSELLGGQAVGAAVKIRLVKAHEFAVNLFGDASSAALASVVPPGRATAVQPIDPGMYNSNPYEYPISVSLGWKSLEDTSGSTQSNAGSPLDGKAVSIDDEKIATLATVYPLALTGKSTGQTTIHIRAWSWQGESIGDEGSISWWVGRIFFPISFPQQTVNLSWSLNVKDPTVAQPVKPAAPTSHSCDKVKGRQKQTWCFLADAMEARSCHVLKRCVPIGFAPLSFCEGLLNTMMDALDAASKPPLTRVDMKKWIGEREVRCCQLYTESACKELYQPFSP